MNEQKNYVNVLKLYDRIIRNPTQGLSHQFEMFRDFVKEKNPKDILEVHDFLALRKEVLEVINAEKEKKKKEKEVILILVKIMKNCQKWLLDIKS